MSAVLTTVAASQPEIIYFPVFVAAAGFLRSQVGNIPGLENVKTMGADGHFTPDFLKAAGAASVGHYLSSPNFAAFGSGYQDFLAKRAAKFGGKPLSVFHAHAYDATNILFAALEKVAVENADGSLSDAEGRPPGRHLRDQGLRGPHRHPDLQRHRRLRRTGHRGLPGHAGELRQARDAVGRRSGRSSSTHPLSLRNRSIRRDEWAPPARPVDPTRHLVETIS